MTTRARAAAPAGARAPDRTPVRAARSAPRVPNAVQAPPCACGGGCPRCGAAPLARDAHDAAEREANAAAERAVRGGEPRVEEGLARARLHVGPTAARAADALGARAFTHGRDVYFGAGQFRPDTPGGRHLIAHEATHVAQQARGGAAPVVQRQPRGAGPDVVEMEPLVVRSTLQPTDRTVPHLDRLTGLGATAGDVTMAHDDASVQRNAPDPARRLPFRATGGWDADAILTALGQYDTLPGTDSDALRCVQAVAMASRIADGPDAVASFLQAVGLDGMLSRPMTDRHRTALEVLDHVAERLRTARATFGDLLWAQEAMHDLFYTDVAGTPEPDLLARMAPALDLGRTLTRMNVWCNGPADVMAAAATLQPGEQLLVDTWTVVFNAAFDQLEEQGIQVAEGRSTVVSVNGRQVRIRRLPTGTRPPHTAIAPVRDSQSGHQLLVLRDGATGALRLYEPEITNSGAHLEALAPDGANFARYFRDDPATGIYYYIQIVGKLAPSGLGGTAP